MNKKIIPVILLAVVAIAAGFAFAPVEQATAVHDSIIQDNADGMCTQFLGGNPSAFWDADSRSCKSD